MLVSGSYFPVLGLRPALGRLLDSNDDKAVGAAPVAVLSYDYWRTQFDQRPDVLNQTLVVNGQPVTIVGVAPRGFDGTTLGTKPKVFVPITMRELMQPMFVAASGPTSFENRRAYWIYLFARLRPGVSIEQAQAAMNVRYHAVINDVEAALQKGMSDQTMTEFRAKALRIEPGARGQRSVHREASTPLVLLLSVTVLVLLIACANIANLLLARSATRATEMAVRLSIGASRRHLIAQLLTESFVLAVCGGLAGLLVANWTLDVIVSLLPADAGRMIDLGLDTRVLVFAGMLALGTGLLFGLFPALHSTRPDLASTLKGQAGQPGGARAASRFRMGLATAQIALSMALLVSAGLFIRSLFNISRVDLGLRTDHLVVFGIAPQLNGYTSQQSKALFERLEDTLSGMPGVTGVTDALVGVLEGNNWGSSVVVEGFKAGPDTDTASRYNEIGPGYLPTLGMPLVAGREFTRADAPGSPKVAIVNQQFARKFNLGSDVIGKRMGRGPDKTLDIEIVGLVRNAKYSNIKDEVPPLFMTPYRQDDNVGFLTFYVRTSLDPEEMVATIPKIVARLDPNLPVTEVRTMAQQVKENVFLDRFVTVLSAGFALLATLLAAVGLYGVLAYTVTQRTREIGLRMALGAAPARVRRMVLRQVGAMTLVGGAIGLAAAIGLGRAAQSLLYQLQGWDPVVLAAAGALLGLVAFSAGFIPALRASRIDPMIALRYQ
jgi:predicted permease